MRTSNFALLFGTWSAGVAGLGPSSSVVLAFVERSATSISSRRLGLPPSVSFYNGGSALLTVRAAASKRDGAMARKKQKQMDKSSKPEPSGFAPSAAVKSSATKEQGAGQIYSRPALYDLAFGYRNYDDEVQFMIDIHSKYSAEGNPPRDVLELAAGPARHSITSLVLPTSPVKTATAVDLSPDMVKYGIENADYELGNTGDARDNFIYVEGDMRNFCPSGESERSASYDCAWILLGSMQHLITNDDAISCLQSAARALRSAGTLIVELPHPRELFTLGECTRNGWEVPLEDESGEEYGELKIVWGDDNDHFDSIRQVRDFTVAMELTGVDEPQSIQEVVPMRHFTAQEIDALARCAGLEVAAMYGALSEEVAVDTEEEAFRLVCVLRRIQSSRNA